MAEKGDLSVAAIASEDTAALYGLKILEKNINELKAEYYIPYAIDYMIKDGSGKTVVLSTPSRWFGVTFKEDRPGVVAKFQEFADQGIYPTPLYKK